MTHPMVKFGLRAGFVLALCTSIAAPVSAQDSVTLVFAWPDDLKGARTFTGKRVRLSGDRRQEITGSGRETVEATAIPEGLLIKSELTEFEVTIPDGANSEQAKLQEFMAKITSEPPSFVVGRDGQYIRLEGLDRFQSNIREAMDSLIGELPAEFKARLTQMIDSFMTKPALEAQVASDWNRDVATWIGATLDMGDVYELTFDQQVAMLGNAVLTMTASFRFVGRVPCNAEAGGKDCVELEMRVLPEPTAMSAALEQFLRDLAGSVPEDFMIEDLRQETLVRVVTEPSTLIPHRIYSKKVTTMTTRKGGETSIGGQEDERTIVYSYE